MAQQVTENTHLLPTVVRSKSSRECIIQSVICSSLFQILPSILLGCIIWFGSKPEEALTLTSIRLLSVFTSCIFALLTTSVPISLLVLTSLSVLSLTQSFQCEDRTTGESVECRLCGEWDQDRIYDCHGASDAFEQSLIGFSNSVVWLIFAAFHLGKAVEVTGLGQRLSLWMIQRFGNRLMGLAYAILFSELLLAPFVPSNTARGGGIVLPVVQSICTSLQAHQEPRIGGYLMLVGAHANLLSASMYLTGMAPNPIVLEKANRLFPDLDFNFMSWIVGSSVPGLTCALLLPIVLYYASGIYKKQRTTESQVTEHAREQLRVMGHISRKELQLCMVLFFCLCLWTTSSYTHIDSTLVALLGVVALLYSGTIEWKDVSNNTNAWETLFWLGGFITMATQLSEAGASAYLGIRISSWIHKWSLPTIPSIGIAYFLTTFLFSSLSAHTVAFVGTFLEAGHALGANSKMLTCLLAYFGALGGCMTHFSTGTLAMYFASGYISQSRWFLVGALMAVFYMSIYLTLGYGWWTLLGWNN
ncbi:Sodium/sulfate symporter [Sporodiniella umbellata]|nr:Sodium/sulfate symporter [Sporodiniella umbellata]